MKASKKWMIVRRAAGERKRSISFDQETEVLQYLAKLKRKGVSIVDIKRRKSNHDLRRAMISAKETLKLLYKAQIL